MSNEFALESVEVSSSPRERFVEYLQSKGKRVTQQRLQLVDHIFQGHDHFDADELVATIGHLKDQGVSRATIYRALDELVEAGLLRAMNLAGRRVYEHDYGYPQHDHLHCKHCDKLIEFHSEELQTIREAVAREHSFRVTGHRLIITGVCGDCGRKQNRRQSPLDLV
ncbi:MAG: Fur family transcriptional regulator [Aeoliella sp.]